MSAPDQSKPLVAYPEAQETLVPEPVDLGHDWDTNFIPRFCKKCGWSRTAYPEATLPCPGYPPNQSTKDII